MSKHLRHIVNASQHAVAVINCVEMAHDEKRRDVAFWLLDIAASHRRRYIAERRAALAKAQGGESC